MWQSQYPINSILCAYKIGKIYPQIRSPPYYYHLPIGIFQERNRNKLGTKEERKKERIIKRRYPLPTIPPPLPNA